MTGQEFIPIIDMSGFTAGDPASSAGVVDAVRGACEEIGFFVVTGHGVPEALITRMYDTSRAFFDLPPGQKARVAETGARRGGLMHFGFEAERLAGTRGEATPGDLKESLDYGPHFWGDAWPGEPAGLEAVWHEYYRALSGLAGDIRGIFTAAIGLPAGYLDDKFDDHMSTLRVLDYPDTGIAPLPGQLRAGAHTDYGVLTILRSEDKPGGLQVLNRAGAWLDVPAVAGGFVVNIGDAMMRWTNDRWVSTLHRVVNPPADARGSCRRQSIAFFHNLNRDAVIECLAPFHGPDDPPKHAPIAYGDYAELRYRQAHGADKTLGLGAGQGTD